MAINPLTGVDEDEMMPTADDLVKEYMSKTYGSANPLAAKNSQLSMPEIGSSAAPKSPQQDPTSMLSPDMAKGLMQSPNTSPDLKAAIAKKFDLGEYNDENRKKLVEESKLGTGDRISAALAAAGAGFMGKDANAAGQSVLAQRKGEKQGALDAFDKGRKSKIEDYSLDRQVTGDERADKSYADNQAILERERDPSSVESKMAQDLAKSMGYKGDTSGLTAEKFKAFSPALQKAYEIREKSLDRQESRETRTAARNEARNDKLSRNQEVDMQKLGKDVAGTQDLLGGIDEVEAKLGGKLESFTRDKNGNLTKDGKQVDLPGVSVPGFGRTSFYSGEARELQGAADKIFNTTLKDRSGGAVTDTEMDRLKNEFNSGKYNSEPELIDALQRFKRATARVLKNREAGYSKDVVDKYKDQGGRTSDSVGGGNIPAPKSDKPKTVTQNGVTYTLNEETGEYE